MYACSDANEHIMNVMLLLLLLVCSNLIRIENEKKIKRTEKQPYTAPNEDNVSHDIFEPTRQLLCYAF